MLAGTRKLRFPSGRAVETPLLIPSISSKGFKVFQSGVEQGLSEVSRALRLVAPQLSNALLISGYDLHYKYLSEAELLSSAPLESIYATPESLFIDSGGYESRAGFDEGDIADCLHAPKSWTEEDYEAICSGLSTDLSIALVSFDKPAPYDEQVSSAQRFFARHRGFLPVFLLKPTSQGSNYLRLDRLTEEQILNMSGFSVLGVTEKELGNSLIDRLKSIAKLRQRLRELNVDIPIHIFGGLDPLLTPLYFIAGAELFDGLTWLRYAFNEGLSIYPEAVAVLQMNLEHRHDVRQASRLFANLAYLDRLSRRLKEYVAEDGAENVLDDSGSQTTVSDVVRQVRSALKSAVGEV